MVGTGSVPFTGYDLELVGLEVNGMAVAPCGRAQPRLLDPHTAFSYFVNREDGANHLLQFRPFLRRHGTP
jgi:hypothetical protein